MWNRKVFQAAFLVGVFAVSAPIIVGSNAATTRKAVAAKPMAKPVKKVATASTDGTDVTVSYVIPPELNPNNGGAPNATPLQAAVFAWDEFIALNWPTAPGLGRETPGAGFCPFGSTRCGTPLVWETMRTKVETFPGNNQNPPGYVNQAPSYGYNSPPQYNYGSGVVQGPCDASQQNDPTPWINLDETDQITLDNMYAGNAPSSVPGNSAPQLVRFLAKSNHVQYEYVARNSDPNNKVNQWWSVIPASVNTATRNYINAHQAAPPADSSTMVSQPYGTVELKAGWRELNSTETASGHFHMQRVRFYEQSPTNKYAVCWRDATWGLVSLHVIQKTPTAPYFIYATFEQTDNILTASGQPVEDVDGNVILPQATATTPQVCMNDPQPAGPPNGSDSPSYIGQVYATQNPATCVQATGVSFCTNPGKEIYYENAIPSPPTSTNSEPTGGFICVNQRVNPITPDVIAANVSAHAAITKYLMNSGGGVTTTPFLYYKLVNVQYYPYDHVVPGSSAPANGWLYTPDSTHPISAQNPTAGSYYLANILVETNRSLQQFSGGLSPQISTVWNDDSSPHKNSYYNGHFYNMGGCMGCHGSQGQNPSTNPSGDFSVILSRGAVIYPEVPSVETNNGLATVARNRSLSK